MEKRSSGSLGSRRSDFTKSFKLALHSLLTSCSKQEFVNAFSPDFDSREQDTLHRLFIQVIASLHKMIEDEFESLGLETQAGTTLDAVDQLVEEQSLDSLYSKKTNLMDVAHDLSAVKRNEIQCLMGILGRAEEQNRHIRARIEMLKKGRQDFSSTTDVGKHHYPEKMHRSMLIMKPYVDGFE